METQLDIFDFLEEMEVEEVTQSDTPEEFSLDSLELIESNISQPQLDDDTLLSLLFSRNLEPENFSELDFDWVEYTSLSAYYRRGVSQHSYFHFTEYRKFFMKNVFFTGYENEVLDDYEIEGKFRDLYKPTIRVEAFEQLPLVNLHESKLKLQNTLISFTDHLFRDFERKLNEDKSVSIFLPDDFVSKLNSFLSYFDLYHDHRDMIEVEDYPLYFLLEPFMKQYYHNREDFASFSETVTLDSLLGFMFQENISLLSYEDSVITLSINFITDIVNVKNKERQKIILNHLNKVYNFTLFLYLAYDMHDYFAEHRLVLDEVGTDDETFLDCKEAFEEALASRLVPVELLSHKTAVKEAEKRGMTHFLIPFTNDLPAFDTAVPMSLYKSFDHFGLLPPTQTLPEGLLATEMSGIETYQGHFEEFRLLATRSDPHVVGENTYIPARINEDRFNQVLLEEYQDWEHYDVLSNTLSIIEEFPLVRKRLTDLQELSGTEEASAEELFKNLLHKEVEISDSSVDMQELEQSILFQDSFTPIKTGSVLRLGEDEDGLYSVTNKELVFQDDNTFYKMNLRNLQTNELISVSAEEHQFFEATVDEVERVEEAYIANTIVQQVYPDNYRRKKSLAISYTRPGVIITHVFWKGELVFSGDVIRELERSEITNYSHSIDGRVIALLDNLHSEGKFPGIETPFLMPFSRAVISFAGDLPQLTNQNNEHYHLLN